MRDAKPGGARPAAQPSNQRRAVATPRPRPLQARARSSGLQARSAGRTSYCCLGSAWLDVSQARDLQSVLRETGKLQVVMLRYPSTLLVASPSLPCLRAYEYPLVHVLPRTSRRR